MFVTHLESALDGTRYEAGRVWTIHEGRPLWVRYDLAAVGRAVRPDDFAPARLALALSRAFAAAG